MKGQTPVRPVIASAVVALLVATSLTLGVIEQAAADPTSALSDSNRVTDEATALLVAQRYGHAVAVDSETTPISQVSVLPDGSKQLQNDSLPVRTIDAGQWVSVDTTLTAGSDGMVVPKESAARVEFSPGGAGVMARVQTSTGSWVGETWPLGSLPAPSVNGDSATYANVLPGTDLKLTATAGGMSEVLVVNTPQAAANPGLANLQLAISGGTVSSSPQSLSARAGDGSQVLAAQPTWWDSSEPGASSEGPGGDGGMRPLQHTASASAISLNVAAAATTPALTYPIYIDPDWSTGTNAYWFTDRAYPDQSYLNGQSAGGIQSVGNGGGYLSRAFWQFPTSPLNGKHILAAQFSVTEVWSNTCTGKDIQAWHYGNATPGFTWNTDPGYWNSLQDTKNLSAGSTCSAAAAVGFNVLGAATWAANGSVGTLQIGLRAADETDTLTRRHFSQWATLTVTYNSPPNTPANPILTSPQRGCGTSSAPAYVGGAQAITFQVTQTDPDAGDLINDAFYVYNSAGAQVWSAGMGQHAQGPSSVTMPQGTLPDGPYHWMVRAGDGIDLSASYSTTCYFTIKSTHPALPTLTPGAATAVGVPVTVTLGSKPTDAVLGFLLWWEPTGQALTETAPAIANMSAGCPTTGSGAGKARFVCADGSGNATVQVAPINNISTLWVESLDQAGNTSLGFAADGTTQVTDVGKEFDLSVDPNVINNAHWWHPATPPVSPIVDGNTTSPLNLNVGTADGWDSSDISNDPALNFTAYPVLDRFYGSVHSSGINGSEPSGTHLEGEEGGMLQVGSSQPTNTNAIYLCSLSTGVMSSTSSSCDGKGATGQLVGYSGKAATVFPPSLQSTARQVYHCATAVDYFDTTSATCEGTTLLYSLGWFIPVVGTKTASAVLDTTKSYTVSALLKPTAQTSTQNTYVALSEAGPTNSSFYLEVAYNTAVKQSEWRFCVQSQVSQASPVCVWGGTPDTTQLREVSGVWDATNDQIRLVQASPTGMFSEYYAQPTNEVTPTGGLLVGATTTNGARAIPWDGLITDVAAYPGVVDVDRLESGTNP